MPEESASPNLKEIDAGSFQRQIESLAVTLINKVEREGLATIRTPEYVVTDIGVLIRKAIYTYDALYFLNTDGISSHTGWRLGYSFAVLPVLRTMIDCLYNATALMKDPVLNGRLFRMSGYLKLLSNLDKDEARYGHKAKWKLFIDKRRSMLRDNLRGAGFKEEEIRASKEYWPTLSKYVKPPKGVSLTEHQQFLKAFSFGFWDEYSAISHATFPGLMETAPFYMLDRTAHEERDALREQGHINIDMHLFRAAGILLSLITEVQLYFRFEGASIVERLNECWKALGSEFFTAELYEGRYKDRLQAAGMLLK